MCYIYFELHDKDMYGLYIIVNKFYWDMQRCLSLSENQHLPSLRCVKQLYNALQSRNNTCAMSIWRYMCRNNDRIIHYLFEIIDKGLWQYMCINCTRTRNVVCPRTGIIHCQVWGMWMSATIHYGALTEYVQHLFGVIFFDSAQRAISSWNLHDQDVRLYMCTHFA